MKPLPKKEKIAYLVGMLGQNILYVVVNTGLAYYYQSVIFLPAMAISIIFGVMKIIDALKDIAVGAIIDKTNTKYGKCRPYLIYSIIPCFLLTCLVFVNTIYGSQNSRGENIAIIIFAAVSYFIWCICFAMTDIPLWTLPNLMSENEKDRNILLSYARIAGTVAAAVMSLLLLPVSQSLGEVFSKKLSDNDKGLQLGMLTVVFILTFFGSILFSFAGIFTKERVTAKTTTQGFKDGIKTAVLCIPYRKLMLSGIIRGSASTVGLVQMTFYSYYFGDNGKKPYVLYMFVLGIGAMIGQVVSGIATPKLSEKYDNRKLFVCGNVVAALSFFLTFVLFIAFPTSLDKAICLSVTAALLAISSTAQGVVLAVQSFMIADAVTYEEKKSGIRPDGIFFSGQSLLVKLSSGIGSLISGIVFSIVGFSSDGVKKVNEMLYNGASFKSDPAFAKYRLAIFVLFALVPAMSTLLSVVPFIEKFSHKNESL